MSHAAYHLTQRPWAQLTAFEANFDAYFDAYCADKQHIEHEPSIFGQRTIVIHVVLSPFLAHTLWA